MRLKRATTKSIYIETDCEERSGGGEREIERGEGIGNERERERERERGLGVQSSE